MKADIKMKRGAAAAVLTLCTSAILSGHASAQSLSEEWRFRAILYMWAPKITGTATFSGGTVADIDVKFHDIIDHLKMTGMGAVEAQKGRWGAFTDVVYLNVGGTRTRTRDGTIDGVPLPVGVTSNARMDLKTWIWTLAGSYRVQATADSDFDVLAGARMLSAEPRLTYDFNVDVGPFTGPGRSGSRTVKETNWDGIVGVKGRARFGPNKEWFIPYYVDLGTGNSDFTWQISGGIGYAYPWGELIATWRYLDYKFKSDTSLEDLTVNGPVFGAAFPLVANAPLEVVGARAPFPALNFPATMPLDRVVLSLVLVGGALLPASAAQAQEGSSAPPAAKAPATALSRDSRSALNKLYAQVATAKTLGERASAVLVFPKIRKAGFVVGGQYGEGTLFRDGKPVAYYSTSGLSYGLQAGAQQFGYALFFMNDNAVRQLDKAGGFEVGVGPSVVVVDQGAAKNVATTTMSDDIYAFVFSQKGLMAGVGLRGNKVTRISAK